MTKQKTENQKNKLKQVLYQLLAEETGHTLPWGNLTGIRPTKIAMGLIESGMSNAEAADICEKHTIPVMKRQRLPLP